MNITSSIIENAGEKFLVVYTPVHAKCMGSVPRIFMCGQISSTNTVEKNTIPTKKFVYLNRLMPEHCQILDIEGNLEAIQIRQPMWNPLFSGLQEKYSGVFFSGIKTQHLWVFIGDEAIKRAHEVFPNSTEDLERVSDLALV